MTAPMALDGAMNGPAFLAWVEHELAPTLAPGDIVVMDNLPTGSGARGHRKPRGRPHYLPPYSPDLNSIETA